MSQLDNNVEDDQQDNDVHLLPGDGINLDGKLYIVQSRSTQPHGYIVTDPLVRGVEHKMRNRDIKDWHDRQRLRFVMASEGRFPLGKQESLERSLRAFTEVEQTEMYRRQRYCLEVDSRGKRFERTEVNMTALTDEVAERHGDTAPHGWASVNEWWVDWDRAGRDIRVLCPSYRRRGNRERRLEPFMTKAMENGVKEWLDLGRPKMSTRYINVIAECMNHHGGEEICMQILKADPEAWLWPSYKTFTIACRSVDRTTKISRRQGAQAARAEMHPVGDGPDVRLPFQRVEADFKYLRIFVVDDVTGFPLGTPYLMAAIDCFSGMIAGFDIGFDPPSYVSAARCLKHVIGFKKLEHLPRKEDGSPIIKNAWPVNGVPRTFVLDNDAAFHAESFEKTAKALNCHIDYVPPGEPWEKGKIERFWGTVQTAYVDMFPGNVLRIDKNPDVTYDPRKDATVTLSQLRLFITKALVDVHHIGIEPETYKRRIDIWNEAVAINPPRPVRDHGSLLELVGAYKKRRAERRGIRIFGLRYRSDALQKYRNGFDHDPMVEVRYDPQNIAVIQVIDREHGTSFEAKCSREDYAKGLSEHQHKVIQRRAKEIAGLGQMKRRSGGDLRLRAFDWEDEDDRDEWLEMMDTIQEHMFLKVEPELGTDDMARNMHQATGGIMDNIMKLVFRATSFAHRDKAEFVGKGHLAQAFERLRRGDDESINPFGKPPVRRRKPKAVDDVEGEDEATNLSKRKNKRDDDDSFEKS